MENKKCKNCGHAIEDETLKECPECGEILEVDADNVVAQNSLIEKEKTDNPEEVETKETATDETSLSEDVTDEAEEVPAANKKVKIITATVAIILVFALGLFGWHMFKGKDEVKDMAFEEISGLFNSHDGSSYFEFKIEETKVEIPVAQSSATSSAEVASDAQVASDSAALSSGAVASDAAPAQKTQTSTFDGTYKSGYTLEYVQRILAQEYVIRNNLNEEYQSYCKEKKIILDDYLGFVKQKGVSQSELDEIDKETQFSAQRLEHEQSGYWNYNEKTKEIEVYDAKGKSINSTLKISGDVIVNPEGFFNGEYSLGKKSRTVLSFSDEGISEELILYNDGNFILKLEYDGQGSQCLAGEYEFDDKYVVLDVNGQRVPHLKVKGGLAGMAFVKQTSK